MENNQRAQGNEIGSGIQKLSSGKKVYLITGYTDMRRGVDGLAAIIDGRFGLDVFSGDLFLFCGHSCHKMKCLLWEGDGFILLIKRLADGVFHWPRGNSEAIELTAQQLRWLLEGLSIDQPGAHRPSRGRIVY